MYSDEIGIFFQEIVVGSGGVFVYSSTPPAFGTLVGNITAAGGTDPYGNVYLGGQTSYRPVAGGFEAAQNFGGAVTFYTAPSEAGPWTALGFLQPFGNVPTTTLQLGTPAGGALLVQNGITILAPSNDATGATDIANISAAYSNGNSVWLAPGTWNLNQPVKVDTDQELAGFGPDTKLVPGTTFTGSYMIALKTPATTARCTIRDFLIDINYATNVAAGTIGGIQIDNTGWTSSGGDQSPYHNLRNLHVVRASGDCYHLDNVARELRMINCIGETGLGYGVFGGDGGGTGKGLTDSRFSDCTMGNNALNAWELLGSNNLFTNCKGYGSGNNQQTGVFASTTYNWHLNGTTAHCKFNTFASCHGQQAGLHNWFLDSCAACAITGCDADAAGAGAAVPAGYGMLISSALDCAVTGLTGSDGVAPSHQVYGVAVQGACNRTWINGSACTGITGRFLNVSGAATGFYLRDGLIRQIWNGSSVETFLAPSGDATGVADTAAIGAAITAGGMAILLPGIWHVNCGDATLTTLTVNQYIQCEPGVTILALGSGDLFGWSFAGAYSGNTTIGGGIIGYPMIDGTSTTGNATAVHAGDIESLIFQARVRHFKAGTASWGFLFDNQNHFTERLELDIEAIDCGNTPGNGGHVGFNVSGGGLTSTSSFKGLSARITVSQSQGTNQQDGIVLQNGARLYDCTRFEFTGNFRASGAATTAAAVRITGQVPAGHPDAGVFSQINTSHLVWTPECAAGANPPTTIVFGTPGSNVINESTGLINFSTTGGASFAAAGNAAIQAFQFDGPVYGDADLMRIQMGGHQHYDQASLGIGGTIITRTTGVVRIAQTAAATGVILQQPLLTGQVSGQTLDIWNTAAVGSGFDITFAAPGTSFVAGGTNVTIKAGFGQRFVWDYNQFLWFTV